MHSELLPTLPTRWIIYCYTVADFIVGLFSTQNYIIHHFDVHIFNDLDMAWKNMNPVCFASTFFNFTNTAQHPDYQVW